MIPKIIHYCWFGRGELPELAKKCIASWEKYCPDYQIIRWDEDNFDVNALPYTRFCYEQKKYAFLSDYVRLKVVHDHGGLYFDTDVEVLRPFDELLNQEAFFGWESEDYVNTGVGFGAEKKHPAVAAMLAEYHALQPNADGSYQLATCPVLNTQALQKMGLRLDGSLQKLAGAQILPVDYMNPYDDPTGKLNKTKNTLSIHWYSKSWMSKGTILRSKLTKPFHRIFGKDCFKWLKGKKA